MTLQQMFKIDCDDKDVQLMKLCERSLSALMLLEYFMGSVQNQQCFNVLRRFDAFTCKHYFVLHQIKNAVRVLHVFS